MIKRLLIHILLAAITLPWQSSSDANLKRLTRSVATKLTAELLIVCDKEFGDHFHHDRQQIIDYWSMYLWEVNMKFKTLTKVDISFRITQIVTLKKNSEQKFIEDARSANRSEFMKKLLTKFSDWVYEKNNKLTKFDIAFLATGAGSAGLSSRNHVKLVCQSSIWYATHYSTFVVHFDNPWGRYCSLLEAPLASLLGAPWDANTEDFNGCKSRGFIMGSSNTCGRRRYFFSKCSDNGISDYVRNVRCLKYNVAPAEDVLVSSSKVTHPSSLHEQCSMQIRNGTGEVAEDDTRCIRSRCFKRTNENNLTFVRNFYPFDNSPCGTEKYCFRGRCLPRGHQIRNVGSGTCLHMRNRFVPNDYPNLVTCATSATPLDQFRIISNDQRGMFLAIPYSTADGNVNADKCLSLDLKEENLQFSNCTTADKKWLNWELILVNGTRSEFLLYHPLTQACAYADTKYNIKANQSCNRNDKRMHWKFHERAIIPQLWFKIDEKIGSNSLSGTATNPPSESSTSENVLKTNNPNSSEQLPNQSKSKENENVSMYAASNHENDYSFIQTLVLASAFLILGTALGICILNAFRRFRNNHATNVSEQANNSFAVSFRKE